MISETTFNLASLKRAILDADICPLRANLDRTMFDQDIDALSSTPAIPSVPIPRYVMTKSYQHCNKVDLFDDAGYFSSAQNPQPTLPSPPPTLRPLKRKNRAEDTPNNASSPPVSSTARPQKPLPRLSAAFQVRVASTSAPSTLPPSRPVPCAPEFAILPDNTDPIHPPPKKRLKARSQDAKQRRRASQHAKRNNQPRFSGLKDIWLKHLAKTKVIILTNFDIADVPCGTGGWRGSSRRTYHAPRTLQEAIKEGFRQLEWDRLETIAVLDCQRRLIILLRKRDISKEGLERQERMTETMRKAAKEAKLSAKTGGKGDFYALREGVVHSSGTEIPLRVDNLVSNRRILHTLLNDPDFLHEARQSDITWRMYNPNMHSTYWDIREAVSLHPDCENLKFPFNELPFALTTFNFGPQTVCETHVDDTDNTYGWAPLRAFGPYNYCTGGHIVFPTLRLVVQFPQGAEAWFPTALFPHANTQIGADEVRYSVTSYNSGGLSEFVYRGGNSKRGWLRYLKEYSMGTLEAERDMERPALLLKRMFPKWL
ncbi:hypothetical protein CYLTODRAFT_495429 [Cylindrobasidium torrendii FP15055 ss-10]|uniref:Uncharacterized protein n=1 Tax=Cylindrobasidium torrendii FP15055 ss-10 TaxID=1314674 RepID=A0A0D7AT67_9AGAR|nr:hypothetical protein CYLTODRAFT_495429 [Cylindrobasidium torrendii FP15055 ss-10]